VPEKLKVTSRDNTFVKRRKEKVVDVLADIKKATAFIDGIVEKSTPRIPAQEKSKALQIQKISSDDAGAEEDEDDEATEVKAKNPFKANR
jgi:ABC-type nitrate/sulfonate/bicarbonate transport system substrate-binding protein